MERVDRVHLSADLLLPKPAYCKVCSQPLLPSRSHGYNRVIRFLNFLNLDGGNVPIAYALDGAFAPYGTAVTETFKTQVAVANDVLFVHGKIYAIDIPSLRISRLDTNLLFSAPDDFSNATFCSSSTGGFGGLAVTAINSTHYVIIIQRARGTFFELHQIDVEVLSFSVIFQASLFRTKTFSNSDFGAYGAEVVKKLNSTHLLLNALSPSTVGGSPALLDFNFAGIPRLRLFNENGTTNSCPIDAIPFAAELSSGESDGLLLSLRGQSFLFSTFNTIQMILSTSLSLTPVSTPLSLSRQDVGALRVRGDLPAGFTSAGVSFIAADAPIVYKIFSANATTTIATDPLSVNTTVWGLNYAVSPSAPTFQILYLCDSIRYCVANLSSTGETFQSIPSPFFANPALDAPLMAALIGGGFVAAQRGSQQLAVYKSGFSDFGQNATLFPQAAYTVDYVHPTPSGQFGLIIRTSVSNILTLVCDPDNGCDIPKRIGAGCTNCANFVYRGQTQLGHMLLSFEQVTDSNFLLHSRGFLVPGSQAVAGSLIGFHQFAPNFFIGATPQSLFVLDASNASIVLKNLPFDPLFHSWSLRRLDIQSQPSSLGYNIILTLDDAFPWFGSSPRTVSMDYRLCWLDSQCPPSCVNFTCPLEIPSAPLAPPLARPASPTLSCSPPIPLGALCVDGVYIIQGNVTTGGQVVIATPVVIEGSLKLSNGSTVVLQNSATINVTGCLSVGGSLAVSVSSSQAQSGGTVNAINFDGGYCGGQKSTFENVTVTVTDAPACAKTTSEANYGPRSISVVFTYDISGCSPVEVNSAVLTIGGIIGIAVAGVVVVALILAAIVWAWFRKRVRPFQQHERSTTTELDE
jgi:hypothetical protein